MKSTAVWDTKFVDFPDPIHNFQVSEVYSALAAGLALPCLDKQSCSGHFILAMPQSLLVLKEIKSCLTKKDHSVYNIMC